MTEGGARKSTRILSGRFANRPYGERRAAGSGIVFSKGPSPAPSNGATSPHGEREEGGWRDGRSVSLCDRRAIPPGRGRAGGGSPESSMRDRHRRERLRIRYRIPIGNLIG